MSSSKGWGLKLSIMEFVLLCEATSDFYIKHILLHVGPF